MHGAANSNHPRILDSHLIYVWPTYFDIQLCILQQNFIRINICCNFDNGSSEEIACYEEHTLERL